MDDNENSCSQLGASMQRIRDNGEFSSKRDSGNIIHPIEVRDQIRQSVRAKVSGRQL